MSKLLRIAMNLNLSKCSKRYRSLTVILEHASYVYLGHTDINGYQHTGYFVYFVY